MTDKRESGWKRAWRSYDRFGESLETSLKPWLVIMGIVAFATACAVAWSLITGEPLVVDGSDPRPR